MIPYHWCQVQSQPLIKFLHLKEKNKNYVSNLITRKNIIIQVITCMFEIGMDFIVKLFTINANTYFNNRKKLVIYFKGSKAFTLKGINFNNNCRFTRLPRDKYEIRPKNHTSSSCTGWVSTLKHKIFNNSMELSFIVIASSSQFGKISASPELEKLKRDDYAYYCTLHNLQRPMKINQVVELQHDHLIIQTFCLDVFNQFNQN